MNRQVCQTLQGVYAGRSFRWARNWTWLGGMLLAASGVRAQTPTDTASVDLDAKDAPPGLVSNQGVSLLYENATGETAAIDARTESVHERRGRTQNAVGASPGTANAEVRDAATVALPRRELRPRSVSRSREGLTETSSTSWYATGLGSLAIVLGLIALVYWLMRRWVPSLRPTDGGGMRIVSRSSLSPRQTLSMVQIGRRFVVVAVSPNRVDMVCEIVDPQEVAELTSHLGPAAIGRGGLFDGMLGREKVTFSAIDDEDESPATSVESLEASGSVTNLLKRLRTLQQSN